MTWIQPRVWSELSYWILTSDIQIAREDAGVPILDLDDPSTLRETIDCLRGRTCPQLYQLESPWAEITLELVSLLCRFVLDC